MRFYQIIASFSSGAFLMIMYISACTDMGTNSINDQNGNPDDRISYQSEIQPIFNSNCTGCHGSSGGLDLTSYTGLMTGGDHGAVISPGDGTGSILIQKLKSDPPFGGQMPPDSSPLSSILIDLISSWIDAGAENN